MKKVYAWFCLVILLAAPFSAFAEAEEENTVYELLDEIHAKLAEKIMNMSIRFANNIGNYPPHAQIGEESFYPRFTEADDELDIDKSIREQFNHIRVADNNNHPLWFQVDGRKYILKILSGHGS